MYTYIHCAASSHIPPPPTWAMTWRQECWTVVVPFSVAVCAVRVCVCVRVCVWERERERESKRKWDELHIYVCMHVFPVFVYVCPGYKCNQHTYSWIGENWHTHTYLFMNAYMYSCMHMCVPRVVHRRWWRATFQNQHSMYAAAIAAPPFRILPAVLHHRSLGSRNELPSCSAPSEKPTINTHTHTHTQTHSPTCTHTPHTSQSTKQENLPATVRCWEINDDVMCFYFTGGGGGSVWSAEGAPTQKRGRHEGILPPRVLPRVCAEDTLFWSSDESVL